MDTFGEENRKDKGGEYNEDDAYLKGLRGDF